MFINFDDQRIDIIDKYMVYDYDRHGVSELVYPMHVNHQEALLSRSPVTSHKFIILSSIQFSAWILILLLFMVCVVFNVMKAYVIHRKYNIRFYAFDVIISVVLDHFLILIGKCKSEL